MNFLSVNFCLFALFFKNSWGQGLYEFNGTSTNCDDSEIEKYFTPGQTFASDPDVFKEHAKITVA